MSDHLTDELRDDTPEMILRWLMVGMPPWGCHYCRGAEYGPDGVPCPACHGRSDEVVEPPLVNEIRSHIEAAEADRDLAIEALEKYGWHTLDPMCDAITVPATGSCSCGYDLALSDVGRGA